MASAELSRRVEKGRRPPAALGDGRPAAARVPRGAARRRQLRSPAWQVAGGDPQRRAEPAEAAARRHQRLAGARNSRGRARRPGSGSLIWMPMSPRRNRVSSSGGRRMGPRGGGRVVLFVHSESAAGVAVAIASGLVQQRGYVRFAARRAAADRPLRDLTRPSITATAAASVGRGAHAPSHVPTGLFASVPGRRAHERIHARPARRGRREGSEARRAGHGNRGRLSEGGAQVQTGRAAIQAGPVVG
jgi:hypothetical protein